jgi:hypothetical protein
MSLPISPGLTTIRDLPPTRRTRLLTNPNRPIWFCGSPNRVRAATKRQPNVACIRLAFN